MSRTLRLFWSNDLPKQKRVVCTEARVGPQYKTCRIFSTYFSRLNLYGWRRKTPTKGEWMLNRKKTNRMDEDVASMSFAECGREIVRLRQLIRTHKNKDGNGRCWMNDRNPYNKALPEGDKGAGRMDSPREVLLVNCKQCITGQKRRRCSKKRKRWTMSQHDTGERCSVCKDGHIIGEVIYVPDNSPMCVCVLDKDLIWDLWLSSATRAKSTCGVLQANQMPQQKFWNKQVKTESGDPATQFTTTRACGGLFIKNQWLSHPTILKIYKHP
jgi:hypothetical protein